MTMERPKQLPTTRVVEAFGLTSDENLYGSVSLPRFDELIYHDMTTIHEVSMDYNNYGQFLFVTVSRPVENERACLTFWGLGFHEQREQWIRDDKWFWYRATYFPPTLAQTVTTQEAKRLIDERQRSIARYAEEQKRSRHARLFELLADLTDDDAASAYLEDLDDLADRRNED